MWLPTTNQIIKSDLWIAILIRSRGKDVREVCEVRAELTTSRRRSDKSVTTQLPDLLILVFDAELLFENRVERQLYEDQLAANAIRRSYPISFHGDWSRI
jgi:hypothetical protein